MLSKAREAAVCELLMVIVPVLWLFVRRFLVFVRFARCDAISVEVVRCCSWNGGTFFWR